MCVILNFLFVEENILGRHTFIPTCFSPWHVRHWSAEVKVNVNYECISAGFLQI